MNQETHSTSLRPILTTTGLLIVLVGLSILAYHRFHGPWGAAITLGLAGVQAAVVILLSMGLKKEKGFHRLIIVSSILFLGFFFLLTLADVLTRGDVMPQEDKNYSIQSPVKKAEGKAGEGHGHP